MVRETWALLPSRQLDFTARLNCLQQSEDHSYDDHSSLTGFCGRDGVALVLARMRPSVSYELNMDSYLVYEFSGGRYITSSGSLISRPNSM